MTRDLSTSRLAFALKQVQSLYGQGREHIGAVVLALGAAAVFGPDAVNQVDQLRHQLRATARDQMPLDVELERTRRMVAEVLPQLQQNRDSISVTEVDLEELEHQRRTVGVDLDRQKRELLQLHATAQESNPDEQKRPVYKLLLNEVSHRFQLYQTKLAQLQTLNQHAELLERHLASKRSAQQDVIQRIRQLLAEVEALETRLHLLQAEQTTAAKPIDRGATDRCEEQLAYLRRRLGLAQRLASSVELAPRAVDELIVPESKSTSILDEVSDFFAGQK